MPRALVIGGTGPTGHYIVNGLLDRGYVVAILHTGRHEVPEIPRQVEHIHTTPFDVEKLVTALGDRTWDLTVATYGRLRRIAEVFVGRTGKFISIGGGPAYRGYMNADAVHPRGMMVPTPETALKVRSEEEDGKGYRVHRTEEVVFDLHPDATHFRYPAIYGRYQIAPREWSVVRRILDKRPFIVVPDAGLTLQHFGGAENMAHAVLLAVDDTETSKGQIYNCGDDKVLTIRQVVDVCTEALGYEWDVVSMPYQFAAPARPLVAQPWTTHRVYDLTKIKSELGYHDVVDPIEGIAQVARWYAEHPLDERGERIIQDPFDYAAEDVLVAAWRRVSASMPGDELFTVQPGYTASYSGPGGSVRKAEW